MSDNARHRPGIVPYLCCKGAADAIAFYHRAFGATELDRMPFEGRIGHAELEIEGSLVMLADEYPENGFLSPLTIGGSPIRIHLDVSNVDEFCARAAEAGARVVEPPRDEPYGDRRARLEDPWGHSWILATPISPRTATDTELSPLARLWAMADLITPMAVRVAATLRLADHISSGHDRLPDLARESAADPDALRRLLRFLVAREVFQEPALDRFALTPISSILVGTHPSATRQWLDLDGFGGVMDLAFYDLLVTTRTGRSPKEGYWDTMPEAVASSYDTVMEAQSRIQAPAIVAGFDWSGVGHVADLGGGTGTLLAEILEAYPDTRGTLVELPKSIERARRVLADRGLAGRCEVVEGDLFEVALPRADLFILKFVLHACDDDAVVRALGRCRDTGDRTGRVLIVERSAGAGDDRQLFTAMDLRMMVLGHGRERTVEEYGALAERAGWRLEAATRSSVGLHLIELR